MVDTGDSLPVKIPKFIWGFLFLHLMLASLLTSIAVNSENYNETVKPFVDIASSIIPSIAGMGALSPDDRWGSMYFMLCLIGSPIYINYFWKAASIAYPTWVREERPFKFWSAMLGALVLSFGSLFFLKPSRHSYVSIRSADYIDVLMKESYLAFGLIAMLLVLVFSVALGASAKAILLRISNPKIKRI